MPPTKSHAILHFNSDVLGTGLNIAKIGANVDAEYSRRCEPASTACIHLQNGTFPECIAPKIIQDGRINLLNINISCVPNNTL